MGRVAHGGTALPRGRPAPLAPRALHPALLLLLALSLAPAAAAAPPRRAPPVPWTSLDGDQQAEVLAGLVGRPLPERILGVSARFLGVPYVVSPLGEGSGQDPDPLFRPDAVDCLTFVEQSLALAYSRRPTELLPILARLRYATDVSYGSRLHLMEAQWLPTNVARGHLRDITRALGGEQTVRTSKVLTPATWQSLSSRALALPEGHQPLGSYPFDVLPLDAARTLKSRFPAGSILVVVREERALKATRITHLGFVVHRAGRVWLRHAARNGYGRVVDEDLQTFLDRNARYRKWPVVGVALFEPQDVAPGAEELPRAVTVP